MYAEQIPLSISGFSVKIDVLRTVRMWLLHEMQADFPPDYPLATVSMTLLTTVYSQLSSLTLTSPFFNRPSRVLRRLNIIYSPLLLLLTVLLLLPSSALASSG